MEFRVRIFEKFHMTEDENEFVKNVDAMGAFRDDINPTDIYEVLSNFYLAKQIEHSAKSQDKSTKAMIWLTVAIVVFTAVQAISALVEALQ